MARSRAGICFSQCAQWGWVAALPYNQQLIAVLGDKWLSSSKQHRLGNEQHYTLCSGHNHVDEGTASTTASGWWCLEAESLCSEGSLWAFVPP